MQSILDVLLLEARDSLSHGDFGKMVSRRLPFSWRTANRLMAIAKDSRLWTHVSNLPPSWGTLYQLSRLPSPFLEDAITDGRVTPRTERKQVTRLQQEYRRTLTIPVSFTSSLTTRSYRVVSGDMSLLNEAVADDSASMFFTDPP